MTKLVKEERARGNELRKRFLKQHFFLSREAGKIIFTTILNKGENIPTRMEEKKEDYEDYYRT